VGRPKKTSYPAQACWRLGACCRALRAAAEQCTRELRLYKLVGEATWESSFEAIARVAAGLAFGAARLRRMPQLRDLRLASGFMLCDSEEDRRIAEVVLGALPGLSRLLVPCSSWKGARSLLAAFPDTLCVDWNRRVLFPPPPTPGRRSTCPASAAAVQALFGGKPFLRGRDVWGRG
jgi:hypothetical protein